MSFEEIDPKVQKSIANREYIKGKGTRFYILTVRYDDNQYGVKLVEHAEEVESAVINGKLDAAKKVGI